MMDYFIEKTKQISRIKTTIPSYKKFKKEPTLVK